ncbi:helix-turn-helix transcriptional regulator [Streptomyces spiralis]|uniref:helix-turn-helix transcriptional regulator n=1 Tax=Streptomyces spiralis TaxID=66376 RepID=UPI0033D8A6B6
MPQLAVLVDAVRQDRQLRVTRQRSGGSPSTRRVDPLGLVAKAGGWYLIARSRGIRAYRAARVTDAEILPDSFARAADFDLAQYWTRWCAEFEASLDQLPVTVHLTPAGLAALPEILGDTTVTDHATWDPDRGRHRLVLHFNSPAAARRRQLSFGSDVEVIDPVEARDDLAEAACRTAALYRPAAQVGRRRRPTEP